MEAAIIEWPVIGKKYKLPICHTKGCTVNEAIESYLIFHEKDIEFGGEYTATYHNEEDEEMGGKKDVDRTHKWVQFVFRKGIYSTQMYYHSDENLWMVDVYGKGKDFAIAFYKESQAMTILMLIRQYVNQS